MSNPSFHKDTPAEEVAAFYKDEIKGKNVIVTGSTTGLGLECARVVAMHGAGLTVIAGRGEAK